VFISKEKKRQERKDKKIKRGDNYGGVSGCLLLQNTTCAFVENSEMRGGGKCPEEEHTTCSGGPTIYCHKRGLRGERKKDENNYNYFKKIQEKI
jgi:hypothetical protein